MNLAIIDECIAAFDAYQVAIDQMANGRLNDFAAEAAKRLKKMRWLLLMVQEAEARSMAESQATLPPPIEEDEAIEEYEASDRYRAWNERRDTDDYKDRILKAWLESDSIEIHTEAFYWNAGRTRDIIRALPGLDGFEATGTRDVRNKLIEHPEKRDSGVVWGGTGWGAPQGPVLKALRYEHQKDLWKDDGLYVNADEFFDRLSTAIQRCMKEPDRIQQGFAAMDPAAAFLGPGHANPPVIKVSG